MANQKEIEKNIPDSLPIEQICAWYLTNLYAEGFRSGKYRIADIVHYLHGEKDRQHWRPELHLEGITTVVDPSVQLKGIDIILQPDGDNLSFDAKLNRQYKYDRCVFEAYLNKQGLLEKFGLNSQVQYILHYMEQTQQIYQFDYQRVLDLANCFVLPDWFREISKWEVKQRQNVPGMYLILVRPYWLQMLFKMMDSNSLNMELPEPLWKKQGRLWVPPNYKGKHTIEPTVTAG